MYAGLNGALVWMLTQAHTFTHENSFHQVLCVWIKSLCCQRALQGKIWLFDPIRGLALLFFAVRKRACFLSRSAQMTELTVIAAFVEQRAISSLSTPSRAAVRSTCGAAEAIHCTHWGGSPFVCGFYQVSSQCHPRIYIKKDEKPMKIINGSPKSSRKLLLLMILLVSGGNRFSENCENVLDNVGMSDEWKMRSKKNIMIDGMRVISEICHSLRNSLHHTNKLRPLILHIISGIPRLIYRCLLNVTGAWADNVTAGDSRQPRRMTITIRLPFAQQRGEQTWRDAGWVTRRGSVVQPSNETHAHRWKIMRAVLRFLGRRKWRRKCDAEDVHFLNTVYIFGHRTWVPPLSRPVILSLYHSLSNILFH